MTELIVTIDDRKLVPLISKAIELIKGVTKVSPRAVDEPVQMVYPRLEKDHVISPEVLGMTFPPLPEGFDPDVETDKMWEEMAR